MQLGAQRESRAICALCVQGIELESVFYIPVTCREYVTCGECFRQMYPKIQARDPLRTEQRCAACRTDHMYVRTQMTEKISAQLRKEQVRDE